MLKRLERSWFTHERFTQSLRLACLCLLLTTTAIAWPPGGGGGKPGGEDPPAPEPDFRYDFVPLGRLPGGDHCQTDALNNNGVVLGRSTTMINGKRVLRPVVWTSAGIADLNEFVDPDSGWLLTLAKDINDAGQIAAEAVLLDENGSAVVWDCLRFTLPGPGETFGTMTFLNVPWQPGANITATSINDAGDVGGWYYPGSFRKYVWTEEDGFVDLGDLALHPASTAPPRISGRLPGGRINVIDGSQTRTTYTVGSQAAGAPQIVIDDLGYIYDDSKNGNPGHSHATHITSFGAIAGQTTSGATLETAALFSDATGWVDLGTLAPAKARSWNDSSVTAMNDTGLLAGRSMNGGSWPKNVYMLTFLYAEPFGMVDLQQYVDGLPAGAGPEALGDPMDINESGVICGYAGSEAYLLLPKPAN